MNSIDIIVSRQKCNLNKGIVAHCRVFVIFIKLRKK